jgi:2-polyprenyl-3-methyl-5-hydroxy-6-metoxy-1,4-benzoquinol methylase
MLAVRSLEEEQMDATDLDPAAYAGVLRDLARVNTVTLARRPTLRFLDAIRTKVMMARRHDVTARSAERVARVPIKILDVGFGDGDMLRAIARWARAHHVAAELVGVDLNPKSAAIARNATPSDMAIDFHTGDYQDFGNQGWDVVISSLVAHHMTQAQLIAFLTFMDRQSRLGWMINDLHRHAFAYHGYPVLARLMGVHPIVRADGQLSIARSYRPGEWPGLLSEAGITGAKVYRAFPFRLCVAQIL